VSVLHDKDILCDASLKSCFDQFLEEWNELTKFTYLGKLVLEVHPDVMGVKALCLIFTEHDEILDFLVKSVLELSKLGTFQVSFWNTLMLREYLEQLLLVTKINSVIISQLQVCIHWVCCCSVNVVNGSLWHQV
jgi:hypothetical protein